MPTLTIDGVQVPRFLYGTAWKEDETQRLTELALRQGSGGIDTANQRRHYAKPRSEWRSRRRSRVAWWPGRICSCRPNSRFGAGRIIACPTIPTLRFAIQVEQSFASSLEHLGAEMIDSYFCTVRPRVRSRRGRLVGLASDGGHPGQRPRAPAWRQQHHPRTAP